MVTVTVIFVMLLLVYRSVITVVLLLAAGNGRIELSAAREIVAFLGYHHIVGLSTFAVNLLVSLGMRRERTTESFSSGGIKRRGRPGKTEKPPTTPRTAKSPTSFWRPV